MSDAEIQEKPYMLPKIGLAFQHYEQLLPASSCLFHHPTALHPGELMISHLETNQTNAI